MPLIKSAIKRMRQTTVRRARNIVTKRNMKDAIKAFTAKPSAETLAAAQSEIDTAVKKNILDKNTAARRKSSLSRQAKEAGVKLTAGSAKKAAPKAKTTAKAAAKPAAKKPATKPAATKKAPAKKPAAKKPAAKK